MRTRRFAATTVIAAMLLTLIGAGIDRGAPPDRVAAQVAATCQPGTSFVSNGSFESPGLAEDEDLAYMPTGWAGSAIAQSASLLDGSGRPVDGNVFLVDAGVALTQVLPTSGYAGATLTLRFVSFPGSQPSVTFGDQEVLPSGTGTGPYTAQLVVPEGAGDLSLSFFSGELDDVSVTLAVCAPLPTSTPTATTPPTATATATATTEPTATATTPPTATATATTPPTATATATATTEPTATPTIEPTATATTEPTATPTIEPTATATTEPTATATATATAEPTGPVGTVRATPRPRLNPTSTPTRVPGEPTQRPTPRPRR